MQANTLNLFSPLSIGKLVAKNRFVAQSMESNSCLSDGSPSPEILEKYKKLAQGKWGVIFVEQTSLDEDSRARKNGLILNKYTAKSVSNMVEVVKRENSDTLLMFQIGPCGTKSVHPVSLVPYQNPETKSFYPVLSGDEIAALSKQWVDSCVTAAELGADGIDFKLCHGYFGNEILRPSNMREDKYGGKEFQKRLYLFQKCIYDIKSRVPSKFIVGSRISFFDGIEGGFGCANSNSSEIQPDSAEVFKLIDAMQDFEMDYVNLSAGVGGKAAELLRPRILDIKTPKSFIPNQTLRISSAFWNYHAKYAKNIKKYIESKNSKRKMRVMSTGLSAHKNNIVSISEKLISDNYTDFMGFGRMIFSDPLFPSKVQQNMRISKNLESNTKNERARITQYYDFLNTSVNFCTGCEGCSKLLYNNYPSGCTMFSESHKQNFQDLQHKEKLKQKNKKQLISKL